MPATAARAEDHQEWWDEVACDLSLRDLPYEIETNSRGHADAQD
jgi:hypothetical protein